MTLLFLLFLLKFKILAKCFRFLAELRFLYPLQPT
nr:MAG TPA: hypothetical protein [Caudoviricetes sp.]